MKMVNQRGLLFLLALCLWQASMHDIHAKGFFKSVVSFATHNPLASLTKVVQGPNNFIPVDMHSFKDGLYCDNFCIVEKGVFYRSAQLSAETLDGYIKQYGIKTVINLRGVQEKESWWQEENAVALHNKVLLFNISTSAGTLTSKEKLCEILEVFDHAPRPMLVHCRAGVDRTGEISALWVLDQMKKSNEEALEQLSIWHRHNRLMYPAKDFLIKIWRGREWFINQYDPKNYPQFQSDGPKEEEVLPTAQNE